jgi:peptidoglycan/LPS O-acetylase OafA/YrhL
MLISGKQRTNRFQNEDTMHGVSGMPKARRYRPDVDGLRAVAIILVILYHLDHSLAPGGFAGVDVFFVISGFVVTRSTLSASARSPIDSILQFWRRRILRILPAVLLLVGVSALAFATVTPPFPPERYGATFRTGIAAVMGMGNVYLYRSSLDYFRADDSANPFVHTWSLGVEEQFYLLFALLFIGILGYIGRPRMRIGIAMSLMVVLGAISYAAFLAAGPMNAAMTYYLIPFRFWEIAAGSLLAYGELQFPGFFEPQRAAWVAAVQALALLSLIAAVWGWRAEGFPSVQITVAVAATAALIAAGKHPVAPVSRLLSLRPFVWVGLISYSLYLWHYFVLQFCRIEIGLDNLFQVLLALAIILLAAVLSYRVVEQPIRHSKAPFARVLLPRLAAATLLVIGVGWLLQAHSGLVYAGSVHSWQTDWLPARGYAYFGRDRISQTACNLHNGSSVPSSIPAACFVSAGAPKPVLLLVGDSHAFADWGMGAFGAQTGAYRFATLAHDGCAAGEEEPGSAPSCRTYWHKLPTIIGGTLHRGDSVLIALYWDPKSQTRTAHAADAIARIAGAAEKIGVEVIVEAPLPTFVRPAYLCTKEWYRRNYTGCSVDRSGVERERGNVMNAIRQLAKTRENVRIWDPLPFLCSAGTCPVIRAGKPLFRDTNHLSYFGSKSLGPSFVRFWEAGRNQVI